MTIRKITELIDIPKRDCIYDILGYLDLALCVDVGAAAGEVTRRIRMAGDCNTRVVAFEPYPGNHQFFSQSTSDLDNIELIKKAVTDRVGRAIFTVPCVVRDSTGLREKHAGYSSVGFLSSNASPRYGRVEKYLRWVALRILNKKSQRPPLQTLTVDTTSIDTEFAGKKIDFMKVDVQGGEAEVLAGSDTMLQTRKIDILYVEWSGDPRVVKSLAGHNYRIYDSTYVVGHKMTDSAADIQKLEQIGFQFLGELKLSTGKVAYELVLAGEDVSPVEAMTRVKQLGLSWIQTDLIAVSDEASARFQDAVRQHSKAASFNADV